MGVPPLRPVLLVAVLLAVAAPVAATEASRPVTIVNATDKTIVFLYEAPRCCDIWEEDMLGDRKLAPGEQVRADLGDFNGECFFSLYVQFEDGTRGTWPEFNACETREYRLDAARMR